MEGTGREVKGEGGPKSCSILTESQEVGVSPGVAGVGGGLHPELGGGVVPLAKSEEVAVAAETQEAFVVGTLGHLGGIQGLVEVLFFLGLVVDSPGDGSAGRHDDLVVGAGRPLGTVGLLGLGGGVGGGGGGQGGVTGLLLLKLAVNGASEAKEVAVAVTSEPVNRGDSETR